MGNLFTMHCIPLVFAFQCYQQQENLVHKPEKFCQHIYKLKQANEAVTITASFLQGLYWLPVPLAKSYISYHLPYFHVGVFNLYYLDIAQVFYRHKCISIQVDIKVAYF